MNLRTISICGSTPSLKKIRRWQQVAMAPFLAACLCLSSVAVLGQENAFPQVKQIFDQKAYGLARQGFLTLAEEGDARAMFYLGVIYNQGLGTAVDLNEAFTWYEKAAKLGHAVAQYNLGNAFKHGRGTAKSDELSLFWWQKAAEQGQENAQYNLGLQYYVGMGVTKDLDKAVYYFQEAANGGHPKAQALIAEGKIPARPPGSRPQAVPQSDSVAQQSVVAPVPAPAPKSEPVSPPPTGQPNVDPIQSTVVKREPEQSSTVDVEPAVEQPIPESKPLSLQGLSEAKPPQPGRPAEVARPPQAVVNSVAPTATPPTNGSRAVLDSTWLRAQNPRRFTIQLAVMSNQTYLESFLSSFGLKGTAKVLEVTVANQKRFHVLLGDFPSEDAAQAQINGLSAKLQALKPWPRSYKALVGVAEAH